MIVTINELGTGQKAVVRGFDGGWGMAQKLEALGLRPGKVVTKVSSQFLAGPVTVIVDGREVAMGRGIAARVQVEPVAE
jgi:ferrous iron transport protein A